MVLVSNESESSVAVVGMACKQQQEGFYAGGRWQQERNPGSGIP